MKKLAVILLSVAAVATILFVPIIKNPKDKILTATDNGYEYCGVDYIGSSFNEFSDIDYMNYNDYLYRFDSDSKNFENVYVKKFSSVFERIFGKNFIWTTGEFWCSTTDLFQKSASPAIFVI